MGRERGDGLQNYKLKAGGLAQVLESLPCKHEALNSNPSIVLPKERLQVAVAMKLFFLFFFKSGPAHFHI
jgi:hypothetical protein